MVISIQILTTIMMLWRGGFFCQMCLWMGCRHGQIGDSCIILKKVFWLVNVLHKSILWHSKQRLFSALNWYDGIKTSQYGVDDDDKDKIRDRSSAAKRESRQPLLVIDVNMWQDEQHTWSSYYIHHWCLYIYYWCQYTFHKMSSTLDVYYWCQYIYWVNIFLLINELIYWRQYIFLDDDVWQD